MKIKFGRQQLKNPTPKSVAWKITFASAMLGYVGFYVQTADWLGDIPQHFITGFCAFVIGAINTAAPFFGVHVDTKTVKTEDVGTIEDKKE